MGLTAASVAFASIRVALPVGVAPLKFPTAPSVAFTCGGASVALTPLEPVVPFVCGGRRAQWQFLFFKVLCENVWP